MKAIQEVSTRSSDERLSGADYKVIRKTFRRGVQGHQMKDIQEVSTRSSDKRPLGGEYKVIR